MSLTTTADILLKDAKSHINDAFKDLIEVRDSETWGHDSFNEEYLKKIDEANIDLMKIKREL